MGGLSGDLGSDFAQGRDAGASEAARGGIRADDAVARARCSASSFAPSSDVLSRTPMYRTSLTRSVMANVLVLSTMPTYWQSAARRDADDSPSASRTRKLSPIVAWVRVRGVCLCECLCLCVFAVLLFNICFCFLIYS